MTGYQIAPDQVGKTLQSAKKHTEQLHAAAQQIAARGDGSGVSGDPVVVRAIAGFYVLHERSVRELAAHADKAHDGAAQAIRAYNEADEKMVADQQPFNHSPDDVEL